MGQRDTVISGAVAEIAAMLQTVYDAGMAEAREKAAGGGEELPARLLKYTEILDAPELSVLYEEVRVDWGEDAEEHDARVETEIAPVEKRGGLLIGSGVEIEIAPVEKRGGLLIGSGMLQEITPGMFEDGVDVRLRYWSGRPTEEQRANTPWEGIG